MLFLSLSHSKTLTYFHIKSSVQKKKKKKKQCPLKSKVKEGLKPIIENLKEQGLFIPCNSPCNTPILGVK